MQSTLYFSVGWSVECHRQPREHGTNPTSHFSRHSTRHLEIPPVSFLLLNVPPVPVLTLGRDAELHRELAAHYLLRTEG